MIEVDFANVPTPLDRDPVALARGVGQLAAFVRALLDSGDDAVFITNGHRYPLTNAVAIEMLTTTGAMMSYVMMERATTTDVGNDDLAKAIWTERSAGRGLSRVDDGAATN